MRSAANPKISMTSPAENPPSELTCVNTTKMANSSMHWPNVWAVRSSAKDTR